MSSTTIPEKVRILIAARAGGRCSFRGCNRDVTEHELMKKQGNLGNFAHIVADSKDGPRGDEARSPLLAKEASNIMLMCRDCHALIDGEHWEDYTEAALLEMKAEHERRIRSVTAVNADFATHLVLFSAVIGDRRLAIDADAATLAVLPRYVAGTLSLSLADLPLRDGDVALWTASVESLKRELLEAHRARVQHVSIFALAPIPSLVVLGYLLGDVVAGEALVKRRDDGWAWADHEGQPSFDVDVGWTDNVPAECVLVVSVSDDCALPEELQVLPRVALRSNDIGLDRIRSREAVARFKAAARDAMTLCSGVEMVHVVLAVPNGLAVEFGRLLLPKAHPRVRIWELHRGRGGFSSVFDLHGGAVVPLVS